MLAGGKAGALPGIALAERTAATVVNVAKKLRRECGKVIEGPPGVSPAGGRFENLHILLDNSE
jgi:hypothetical protein